MARHRTNINPKVGLVDRPDRRTAKNMQMQAIKKEIAVMGKKKVAARNEIPMSIPKPGIEFATGPLGVMSPRGIAKIVNANGNKKKSPIMNRFSLTSGLIGSLLSKFSIHNLLYLCPMPGAEGSWGTADEAKPRRTAHNFPRAICSGGEAPTQTINRSALLHRTLSTFPSHDNSPP